MAKLPLAPFEHILKESGKGIRVSKSATKVFVKVVDEISGSIASDAAEFAKHAGRKTVTDADILLADKKRRV